MFIHYCYIVLFVSLLWSSCCYGFCCLLLLVLFACAVCIVWFFVFAQLHVLGHSLHYLLNSLSPILQPGDLDPCLDMLNKVLYFAGEQVGIWGLSSQTLPPHRFFYGICLGVQRKREKWRKSFVKLLRDDLRRVTICMSWLPYSFLLLYSLSCFGQWNR